MSDTVNHPPHYGGDTTYETIVGNTRYRQARKEAGNVAGDPPLDTTVTFIVEYMLREGIVDEMRRQPSG